MMTARRDGSRRPKNDNPWRSRQERRGAGRMTVINALATADAARRPGSDAALGDLG
jgi:hypothetical protein